MKPLVFFSIRWLAAGFAFLLPAAGSLAAEYPVERPARAKPAAPAGKYEVFPGMPRQVIKGIGFEIQSDSINSGNKGMPEETTSVPHDLVPSERQRFYKEMLAGFRYCRLAGGLYWRGLDAEKKTMQGRWPEQMAELKEMIDAAGIEGISLEYWSPAPFWKATGRFEGGKEAYPDNVLRCFGKDFASDPVYQGDVDRFLKDFAEANSRDLEYLRSHGIPISMWGLQNEPCINNFYSTCVYKTPQDYTRTFLAVAPVVRAFDPKIWIIADSWDLRFIAPVLKKRASAELVDALVVHVIGGDAKNIRKPWDRGTGKPSFQNEYEYLAGPASPARCLNTVMHVMNAFQIAKSPTWFWIHALKPYKNEEASGYSLGFWRPVADADSSLDEHYKGLLPGHWKWNPYNWHAVGSFVRHMPWDCQAVTVKEALKDDDLRIFAFKRPNGKLTVVLANRSFSAHAFRVKTGLKGAVFKGWRYTPDEAGAACEGVPIGELTGGTISPVVDDMTWEFWEQQ